MQLDPDVFDRWLQRQNGPYWAFVYFFGGMLICGLNIYLGAAWLLLGPFLPVIASPLWKSIASCLNKVMKMLQASLRPADRRSTHTPNDIPPLL